MRSVWRLIPHLVGTFGLILAEATPNLLADQFENSLETTLLSGDSTSLTKSIMSEKDPATQQRMIEWLAGKIANGEAADRFAPAMIVLSLRNQNDEDAWMYLSYYRVLLLIDTATCSDETAGWHQLEVSMVLFGSLQDSIRKNLTDEERGKALERALKLEVSTSSLRKPDASLCTGGLDTYLPDRAKPSVPGQEKTPQAPQDFYAQNPRWQKHRAEALPKLKESLAAMNGDSAKAPYALQIDDSTNRSLPPIHLVRELKVASPGGVAWSSDGSKLVVEGRSDFRFTAWDVDGRMIRQLPGQIKQLGLLTASAKFVSEQQNILIPGPATESSSSKSTTEAGPASVFSVIDTATGTVIHEETAPVVGNLRRAFAVSRDGRRVAVQYGVDDLKGVTLFSAKDWKKLKVIELPSHIFSVMAFSDDGKHLGVGIGHQVLDIDSTTGVTLHTIAMISGPISYSPDGTMIAVATAYVEPGKAFQQGAVRLIRLADGKEIATQPNEMTAPSVAWDPKGRFVAFVSENGNVHLWNPFAAQMDEKVVRLRVPVRGIEMTSDGRRFAVSNGDYVSIFEIGKSSPVKTVQRVQDGK